MIVKLLKIKSETKIGLWSAFRRECLRRPHATTLFWAEFVKREHHMTEGLADHGGNLHKQPALYQSKHMDWNNKRAMVSTLRKDIEGYLKLLSSLAEVFSLNSILQWLLIDKGTLKDKRHSPLSYSQAGRVGNQ